MLTAKTAETAKERKENMDENALSNKIIGAAIEV
jgi:hypothetical protein